MWRFLKELVQLQTCIAVRLIFFAKPVEFCFIMGQSGYTWLLLSVTGRFPLQSRKQSSGSAVHLCLAFWLWISSFSSSSRHRSEFLWVLSKFFAANPPFPSSFVFINIPQTQIYASIASISKEKREIWEQERDGWRKEEVSNQEWDYITKYEKEVFYLEGFILGRCWLFYPNGWWFCFHQPVKGSPPIIFLCHQFSLSNVIIHFYIFIK